MSHLDEGQLHALLDGELKGSERTEAEAHLAGCAECRAACEEARAFFQEADALIAAVDLPAGSAPSGLAPPKARARGGFRWSQLAWAATVVLAVSVGWFAKSDQVKREVEKVDVAAAPASAPTPAPAASKAAAPAESAPLAPQAFDKVSGQSRARQAPAPARAQDLGGNALGQASPKEETDAPAQPAAPPAEPDRSNEGSRLAESPADTGAEKKLADAAPVMQERPDVAAREARRAAPIPTPTSVTRDESLRGFAGPIGARIAPTALKSVPMEEAVRILGGSIRLVDGMTPTRILAGEASLVRVVYEDPPKRELWLDQQRPQEVGADAAIAPQGVTTLLPGDTVVVVLSQGARSLHWLDQGGFRLGLTGFLPTDSLRALARRVQ